MKKLLCLLVFIALGCNPKGPYKPQQWWEEEDTNVVSEYDRSIIERLDTATSMDEFFPPEWYENTEDPGCYDPMYDK
jgi:hypothetical protein